MNTLAILLGIAMTAAPGSAHRRKIAVLDFEATGASSKEAAQGLSLLLPSEVRRCFPDAVVISSEDVKGILGLEKQKELLGCQEGGCVVELGGALGVDELVNGKLAVVGKTNVLELRRIDVIHNKGLASAARTSVGEPDAMLALIPGMVQELYSGCGAQPSAGREAAAPSGPALGVSVAPAVAPPLAGAESPPTGTSARRRRLSRINRTGRDGRVRSEARSRRSGDVRLAVASGD